MQTVSETYKSIILGSHWYEVSVVIGDEGVLIDERGNRLEIGGYRIVVYKGAPNGGYRESDLISLRTSDALIDEHPQIGKAIAGEIELTMLKPISDFPKHSTVRPYIRACNALQTSEWIPKGVYYIDTREFTKNDGTDVLKIHGYDRMLTAEADYPSDDVNDYPLSDIDMVRLIAANMHIDATDEGVPVSAETVSIMTQGFEFPLPLGYSMREMLGHIASAYGGSFIIDELGELKLVQIGSFPRETRYLIDQDGFVITFGGDAILV